jgi:hypothetical protein
MERLFQFAGERRHLFNTPCRMGQAMPTTYMSGAMILLSRTISPTEAASVRRTQAGPLSFSE